MQLGDRMRFARGITAFALVGVLASVCYINTATLGTAYADAPIGTKASYLLGKMFNAHGNFGFLNSTADPFTCASTDKGTVYYNTSSGARICDGSAWGAIGSAGATPTPGPFTSFTKTSLTTDGSAVNLISVTLSANQAATAHLFCCFQVIGTKAATSAASAGCDWATVETWKLGSTTTLVVADGAFPSPGNGSNGFYTLAFTGSTPNVQYTLTGGAFSAITSSSLTCEIATHGQANAFAVL